MGEHDKDWKEKDKEACAVINVFCGDGKHPKPPKHKKCCKKGTGLPEFGEVFSINPQTLSPSLAANAPGGIVLLEQLRFATPGIDVTNSGLNGNIVINRAGWYNVASGITAGLNPVPAPLPVFTVSLFKNGVIIPGSTFSNVPISPAQQSNQISADSLVHFSVGDVLNLANTSVDQLFMAAPTLGTTAQTNSAYVKIMMLSEDCHSKYPQLQAYNDSALVAFNSASKSFVDSTSVNISQLMSDALVDQTSSQDSLNAGNNAMSLLLLAQPFASASSYNAALAALNNYLVSAQDDVNAANNVVANLNPANTALSVSASSLNATMAVKLLDAQLVSKDCDRGHDHNEEK